MSTGRAWTSGIDGAYAVALFLQLADDLDWTHARAVDLTGDPGHELARAIAVARALLRFRARTLAVADAIDTAQTLAHEYEFEFGCNHVLSRHLGRAHDSALNLGRLLANVYVLPAEQNGAVRIERLAADLLAAASRLLPAAERERYFEEYLAELWELAQSGAGRSQQLQYVIRQLRNVFPMSFALRSPRRRSAVP